MNSFMGKFDVRKVAVLGAGVMGAQIAAHLANADVPVLLFDLPAREICWIRSKPATMTSIWHDWASAIW